jgi:adenosylcobinamide kinase/adenosylcobinamide-phosphate guanylyltransferase
MMGGRLILVIGGGRSGKSSFALDYVERLGGDRVFVATAPVLDAEMAERVERHRAERAGRGWRTVEEQFALAAALDAADPEASMLVDCLTLWLGNLMYRAEPDGAMPTEDDVSVLAGELAAAARRRAGPTLFVANEVGLGIVPDNPQARRFRDLAGRINQILAAAADEAYFLVSGLPMRIK